ncbi:MAG: hypothetical protein ACXAC5_03315 [Promethearchaeota archaeon]
MIIDITQTKMEDKIEEHSRWHDFFFNANRIDSKQESEWINRCATIAIPKEWITIGAREVLFRFAAGGDR